MFPTTDPIIAIFNKLTALAGIMALPLILAELIANGHRSRKPIFRANFRPDPRHRGGEILFFTLGRESFLSGLKRVLKELLGGM
jgi:hypothetical protein